MNALIVILSLLSIVISEKVTPDKQFPTRRNGDHLTNLLVKDNEIYVAENGMVHILDNDLTPKRNFSTCDGNGCDNINKVMAISGDLVVLCGTGNGGICQAWNGSQFVFNSSSDIGEKDIYLVVSTDPKIPAVGLVHEGSLFLGVTFGDSISEFEIKDTPKTYKYLVSRTNVMDSFSRLAYVYLKDNIYSQYKVYFKSIFRHENFIYILTNQKLDSSMNSQYVSKLIRICINETYQIFELKSYKDVVLSCDNGDVIYNLVQDAVFLPSTKLLVAGFSKGQNPESPDQQSALCVYTLDPVTEAINEAMKDYITCTGQYNITADSHIYLPKDPFQCVPELEFNTLRNDYICPTSGFGVKVTSSRAIQPTSFHKLSDTTERITTIEGVERYGQYPDIVYGTDRGSFGKISIDDQYSIYEYEPPKKLDNHPVTDIHIPEDDGLYILTSRKIFKLTMADCSTYNSYSDVQDGKNPSCGWCVASNEAVKKESCTGEWISSLAQRIAIDISPKYIPAGTETNLTITASNLPTSLNDKMKCVFKKPAQIGGQINATFSGGTFQCTLPAISEHTKVTVEFRDSSVLYGESEIQLYSCREFQSCEMCRASTEIACQWCSSTLNCQDNSTSCVGIKGSSSECPRIYGSQNLYVPAGIQKSVTLLGENLVVSVPHKCVVSRTSETTEFNAIVSSSSLTCNITVNYDENTDKTLFPITVHQQNGSRNVAVVQLNQNEVTVYKCQSLAPDCTLCGALKSTYDCNWCADNSICHHTSVCNAADTCPPPQITGVVPNSGGYKGGTKLTISVQDLGNAIVRNITVGGRFCGSIKYLSKDDTDFNAVKTGVSCEVARGGHLSDVRTTNLTVAFTGSFSNWNKYSFKDPIVKEINPNHSSSAGGALITLTGSNLGIGNEIKSVRLVKDNTKLVLTNHMYFYPNITCTTPKFTGQPGSTYHIELNIDGETYESKTVTFTFNGMPSINDDLMNIKSTLSGGIQIPFKGVHLDAAPQIEIIASYGGENKTNNCESFDANTLVCLTPEAPSTAITELNDNMATRRKRSVTEDSISVQLIIQLDGYSRKFIMNYYRDPQFEKFIGEETTRLFKSDEQELTIQGHYINLVGTKDDYKVYIGPPSECTVIEVTANNLTCRPPILEEQATPPPVTVVLGNFNASIGYVKYVKIEVPPEKLLAIILPVIGGVLLVFFVFLLIGFIKYRGVKGKAMKFEKNLADMELQIKKVFREEFLDMHTTMSRVNESLIEKGFPYNNYQRYCFLMMFPGEWNMEEHPLMHEPVVSKKKVSDHIRGKLKQGMGQFEELLMNKFFLVSIVSTMEKQKKFFLKEKSNMAGHLSVALLGKMEYVHEVLTVLLTKLVDETQAKSQKTLFRRCESITEKLLSNWLVLSLYPHVKLHSGSPLYMLLKGTQLTMESGPIDALTGDSKYTLSEDKLLRQDDKPNTLTLKIMVDNSDEIRDCKVLDCDTISQVKAKCLSQIYVNYPASQLTVDSSDLNLEWHWGTGGRLMIQDEDTTSKRDGQWLRLNTLEHYRVTDGSSMALVDPHGLEQEDYVNLANIRIDTVDAGCNGSVHSNDPLTPPDEESGLIERWHLVKQDSDQQKPESFVVEELYLNRLITTKQSVLEYMKNLFDTILSSTVPPPTKFLFDFLDDLGEKNKVEPDTLHAWKSQCYTIRFWATLINKPYNLFDQRIPSYVETSMEVISQVLIECCSLKAPEYTKDSSPGKLIFKKDMMDYRDKVKQYYTTVKTANQDSEDLRLYLKDLNKFQQHQLSFNRQAALYSLYAQLQPYMEEIMEDLESNEETKSLHLDRKLATLNNFMQED